MVFKQVFFGFSAVCLRIRKAVVGGFGKSPLARHSEWQGRIWGFLRLKK